MFFSKGNKRKLRRQRKLSLHQARERKHWLKRAVNPLQNKAGTERASGNLEGCLKHPSLEPGSEEYSFNSAPSGCCACCVTHGVIRRRRWRKKKKKKKKKKKRKKKRKRKKKKKKKPLRKISRKHVMLRNFQVFALTNGLFGCQKWAIDTLSYNSAAKTGAYMYHTGFLKSLLLVKRAT
eukprot:1161995-Pelagomonas_calceolata.AAC.2